MEPRSLFRLSGGALVLGGIGLFLSSVLGSVLYPDQNNPTYAKQSLYVAINVLGTLGSVLLLLGLPGLYARWRTGYGVLGFIGVVLVALTLMLFGLFFGLMSALIFPALAEQAPQLLSAGPPPSMFPVFITGTVLSTIGPILWGVPLVRGRAPDRLAGGLLVASGVLSVVSFFTSGPDTPSSVLISLINAASGALGSLALAWLGLGLVQARGDERVASYSGPARTVGAGA